MEVYHGTITFHGIAVGRLQYYQKAEQMILQYTVENTRKELERFGKAARQVETELNRLYKGALERIGEHEVQILKEHIRLLTSGSFSRAIESLIRNEKVNASYAVATTRDELVQTFSSINDNCVRTRVESLQEVSNRLIAVLDQIPRETFLGEEPVILAAEELTPTDLMELGGKDKILAILTKQGSKFSHTSILAKTMNIPSLIRVDTDPSWDGCMAVVDGYSGEVFLNPDEETLRVYRKKQRESQEEQEILYQLREAKDITRDGVEVVLCANIANLEDLDSVIQSGAQGIGLLRSEFQYLGRENYPRENELFRAYCKVAEAMKGKPAVIRTVDLGADKRADYMELPNEANPLMGNRGIRICLDRKKMFKAQLRAIYRASAYGNLSIMYPMITTMDEVRQIQEMIREVKDGLDRRGIPYGRVPQGIMIETPAAAFISRELAKEVDFLSLGTNDLTQYLLAMDRENCWLKEKYDEHHPAVFRTIEMVVREGHKEGCKVNLCGELAGETELVETFLRLGVDGLSVAPASVLPVRKAIREATVHVEENQIK